MILFLIRKKIKFFMLTCLISIADAVISLGIHSVPAIASVSDISPWCHVPGVRQTIAPEIGALGQLVLALEASDMAGNRGLFSAYNNDRGFNIKHGHGALVLEHR